MESLLPYYERELTYLRRHSHEFASRYPKVASRLLLSGETCDDPHIERLIESFAFLAARIHKKIDDDFSEISDAMLKAVYPQFLRPFPSASIAQFIPGARAVQSGGGEHIPKGTMLRTRATREGSCRFRTAYDLDILPLQIGKAEYLRSSDTRGLSIQVARSVHSFIHISFLPAADGCRLSLPEAGKIRLFLNGEPSLVAAIREAMLVRAIAVWISTPCASVKFELPADAIRLVGFDDQENLLDHDACVHDAHRLMLEYFAYPEKFNFIDIDLSRVSARLEPTATAIDFTIALRGHTDAEQTAGLLDRIGRENFLLGCTPVLNLFRHAAEPVRITGRATAYPVIPDVNRPQAYDIYEIRRVTAMLPGSSGNTSTELPALFSLRHADMDCAPTCYWHASFSEQDAAGSPMVMISFVDSAFDPRHPAGKTVGIDLHCTNGDLPTQLPVNLPDGDLFMEGGSGMERIRILRKPTQSYRFARGRGAQWRFLSHLTLNHLSLSGEGVRALKEMLSLYDISRNSANGKQISGIVSVDQRPATARMQGKPFPAIVRGIEILITVDETHYVGTGLFLFAQMLDRFFGLYVNINSFTRLIFLSKHSGMELIKCPARSGNMVLV